MRILHTAKWLYSGLIVLGLLLSLWLSSAIYLYFAHLNYHQATPFTVFKYGYYYGHDSKTQFWLTLAVVFGFAPFSLLIAARFKPRKQPLYGAAKFANQKEIQQAGLLSDKGIVVGKQKQFFKQRYLQFAGQQHVLMSAPTRSGKGVGVVIP